ncbi:glycoside hydrolase family 6 protein [Nocardioides sp.]|uniref:glycoside hydrolase family 6 protein n=1 Tax=Nocardioides sp. TaxID=35761 RepID=UPI0039E5B5B6
MLLVLLTLTLAAPLTAMPAHAEANIAAGNWGIYTGGRDGVYTAYAQAKGKRKRTLAKAALQPRAAWLTAATPMDKVELYFREYIDNTQHGDPDKLVQMTIFREFPRTEAHRDIPLTAQEQADYREWIDRAATAIGDTRALILLEPDLPENAPEAGKAKGLEVADPEVRLGLVRYAAQKLAALPRTTIYLDAGAADWIDVGRMVPVLQAAGIEYARGIFVGATHRTSVGADAVFAGRVIDALAAAGHPGKRAVLDTADNGRPYTTRQFKRKHPRGNYNDPVVCRSKREKRCQTIGVPPTTDVTAPRPALKLKPRQAAAVATYVEAFLWIGRPWIGNNGAEFSASRTAQVVRTSPFL